MHPALRHFYYSSTRGGLPLAIDSGATIVFTAGEAAAQGQFNDLLGPRLYYHDGKTHLVYQNYNNLTEKGRLYIVTYDSRYGLSKPIGFHDKTGPDPDDHHSPVILAHNDSLYVVVEKDHNTSPMSILKNRTQGDDMIWELSATEIGTIPTYPKLYNKDGVLINIAQISDIEAGFNKNTSGDFEGVWTAEAQIGTRALSEDEHYTSILKNGDVQNGKIVFIISGRNDDVVPAVWFWKYLIKAEITADGVTYYNWDESFSKTSQLTSAELIDNFRYYNTGADTTQGYIPVATLDRDGNFYDVSGNSGGGYDFIYQLSGEASPTIVEVSLPGAPTIMDGADVSGDGQNGGCALLLAISSAEVYAFFRITSGAFGKIHRYKTVDLGTTWTDEGDVFSDVDAHIYSVQVPMNYRSIGNNQNFVIAGSGASASSALYFKKASFGTVQSETGDPFNVTPYTEAEYNALMERSYFVESGKVTNTGTACTTLIDQSANAQDATVVGSPTLDDGTTPTQVTVDGTNDAFQIPITGLTALSEGTVVAVAKMRTGVAGNFLTASDNTTTNEYLLWGKGTTEKTRANDSGVAIIEGNTTITDAFHIYVFTHQNGLGSCVLHFIDGELQSRTPITQSQATAEGRFLDSFASVTHIQAGRLIRSSGSGWYQFDLKHLAISGTPFNLEQFTKSMKYLSNKYGITLNSHFV